MPPKHKRQRFRNDHLRPRRGDRRFGLQHCRKHAGLRPGHNDDLLAGEIARLCLDGPDLAARQNKRGGRTDPDFG
jgi:hypothetical protein